MPVKTKKTNKQKKNCFLLIVFFQVFNFSLFNNLEISEDKHTYRDALPYSIKLFIVQSLSHVQLFATSWTPAYQASLSLTISLSLLKVMFIESVMPSNHLILCNSLLLLPQSFPASGSFPMSWCFASGGQNIGTWASASVLPMDVQGLFPLGWTGLISLMSKGFSRVLSSTTVQKHKFWGTQPSLWSNSHIHTWLLEKP